MAGLTPAEAYTAMQGTAGGPQGLTSLDKSGDPDTQYTHDCCLLLEGAGGCVRSWGGTRGVPGSITDELLTFIVWLPVPDFTAFPPPPVVEDAPEADASLQEPEPPPPDADAPV
jgi:hypothetical protein